MVIKGYLGVLFSGFECEVFNARWPDQSINQSHFYNANISGVARLSGADNMGNVNFKRIHNHSFIMCHL